MGLVLLIILIVLLIGVLPAWPYSAGWGYRPFGLLTLLLIIVLCLLLFKVIRFWDVQVDNGIRIERNY